VSAFRGGAVDLDELGVVAAVIERRGHRSAVGREAVRGGLKPARRCGGPKPLDENVCGRLVPATEREA